MLSTFRPELCEHKAKTGDVIHYHYVGRLGHDGNIFGRRSDAHSLYSVFYRLHDALCYNMYTYL